MFQHLAHMHLPFTSTLWHRICYYFHLEIRKLELQAGLVTAATKNSFTVQWDLVQMFSRVKPGVMRKETCV